MIESLAKLSSYFPRDANLQSILRTLALEPNFFPESFLNSVLNQYSRKLEAIHPISLIFPTPENGLEGDIFIGNLEPTKDLSIALSFDDLTKNLLVSGSPGTGKTNLITLLMCQMLSKIINFHTIDPKLDYRYLTRFFSNVVIISLKDFRENILRPPSGCPPQNWINYFVDFFTAVFSGLIVVKSILYELVHELYQKNGIYEGSENWPTFIDLLNHAENKNYPKLQKRDYVLDSIISRLRMISYNIGDCLNVQKGFYEELLHANLVLEIAGVMDDIQNLIVQWLSFYQIAYRIHNQIKDENHQTIFFIDEAKRFADKSRDNTLEGGVSPFNYLLAQTREYKLSFCMATQEYHRISSGLKSSSFTTIAFNSLNNDDNHAIKMSMGLTNEQAQLLRVLPSGYCIVKKGYLPPVLVWTPFLPIKVE